MFAGFSSLKKSRQGMYLQIQGAGEYPYLIWCADFAVGATERFTLGIYVEMSWLRKKPIKWDSNHGIITWLIACL